MFANRGFLRVAKAATRPKPYIAAYNMTLGVQAPARWLYRYVSGAGTYPTAALVRTPVGPRWIKLWSHHDLLTMNEIFFRRDYQVYGTEKTIVDFGSNIGISAAYFLTFAPESRLYLFEPVPRNIERLKVQLDGLEGRYVLSETAVGITDGPVSFGIEDTGRYGGIGKSFGKNIRVQCLEANTVIARVVEDRGSIDLLKIDIEGAEVAVVESLSRDVTSKIETVYAEAIFKTNPLSETHEWVQSGSIAAFIRRRQGYRTQVERQQV